MHHIKVATVGIKLEENKVSDYINYQKKVVSAQDFYIKIYWNKTFLSMSF